MRLFRPVSRAISRPLSVIILVAWAVQMVVLLRSIQASGINLASDLSRYGAAATWKGVYSRGEKIGFLVGQTVSRDGGYELQEDGRLQMVLLGATSAARVRTSVQVDKAFELQSFVFSLDPGTGAIQVEGRLEGKSLQLTVKTPSGTRTETRILSETPALALNLPRRLAAAGLKSGQRLEMAVFDPATLRNAPMTIEVGPREVVSAAGRPVPAFRVQTTFSGVVATSWVTDTGEVVREESPLGFMVVKETRDRATSLAVPGDVQADLLEDSAIVPEKARRIDNPEAVDRLVVELDGVDLSGPDVQGGGQTVEGRRIEVRDSGKLGPEKGPTDLAPYLKPELFIESDAPEIVAEARKETVGVAGPRAIAERLVRQVNALLEKKPTVSLPSAQEVLRTRVGDCNEHTVLYVALARALDVPARIAVGLVYLHGGFYYHAWPEVYIRQGPDGGRWMPVDPTLNQFPADATHIRLARGGLDRQAIVLTAIGKAKMKILDVDVRAGFTPLLVGRPAHDPRALEIPLPKRDGSGGHCWSQPS